jgi:O-antigen/teichoic acid export membrane protein
MFKTILKIISFLWFSALLGASLTFLNQIIIARYTTPEEFGEFNGTLVLVVTIAAFAGFGVDGFLLKLFGKHGSNALKYIKNGIKYSVLTTCISIILLLLFGLLINGTIDRNLIFLTPIIFSSLVIVLVTVKFQLEQNYKALTIWQPTQSLIRFVGIIIVLLCLNEGELNEYIYKIFLVSSFLVSIIGSYFALDMYRGNIQLIKNEKQDSTLQSLSILQVAKGSWPFGIATFFHLLYFQSDIIVLKYLNSNLEAGLYSAAFTLISAVYILPGVIYQKFLAPKMHVWSNNNHKKMLQVFQSGNGIMLVIGVVFALFLFLFSEKIVVLFFGNEYNLASTYLMILAFAIPLRFLSSSVGAVLVTQTFMKKKVRYMFVVALFNLTLNIIFIPHYGAIAAAISTLLSEFLLMLLFLYGVSKYVFGYETWKNWFKFKIKL